MRAGIYRLRSAPVGVHAGSAGWINAVGQPID
jgi:hypothetical protein